MVSGGVFDHGTHEEDGPVTWEALASPRHTPVVRRAGDESPTHGTLRAHGSSAQEAQNKRPHRGRPLARGTGAVAEGGRESEGCIGAWTSGNGMATRTRPSKGGPCWCDLLEGPMSNALTLRDMSPGLQEVVGREVATSHISGRAGWWKSPCPDLARGRGGQPPGLLYKALFAPPPGRTPPAATPRARRWQHPQRPVGRPPQRRAVRRRVVVQQPGPTAQERGGVRLRGCPVRGPRDDRLGKVWGGTIAHGMSRRTEVQDPVAARTAPTSPRVTLWV